MKLKQTFIALFVAAIIYFLPVNVFAEVIKTCDYGYQGYSYKIEIKAKNGKFDGFTGTVGLWDKVSVNKAKNCSFNSVTSDENKKMLVKDGKGNCPNYVILERSKVAFVNVYKTECYYKKGPMEYNLNTKYYGATMKSALASGTQIAYLPLTSSSSVTLGAGTNEIKIKGGAIFVQSANNKVNILYDRIDSKGNKQKSVSTTVQDPTTGNTSTNTTTLEEYRKRNKSVAQTCNTIFGSMKDDKYVAGTVGELLQKMFNYIKIIGPMLVVILSSLDFIKIIATSDEEQMKKAQKRLVVRLIAAISLFFLPMLIVILLNMVGQNTKDPMCGIQ